MAKKTDGPLTAAPAASSSDEEEVASSDEQEEEQSESANSSLKLKSIKLKKKHSPKKPPPSASLQPQHSSSESGSESDSESESKNDRSVATANPTVKPNASKSMEESRGAKNSSSQPRESLSKSGMKRSIGNNSEGNDNKRVKKGTDIRADDKVCDEDDGKAKKLFQRVWDEEDEVMILEGAVEYKKKTGTDASKNMKDFYGFIKQFLRIDVSKNQVIDKFWRLKKKYINNSKRGKNGQDPSFTKAHDKKVYDVSKMIWIVGKADEKSFRFNEDVPCLNIQRIETPCLGQNSDFMISFKEIMNFSKYADENFLRRGLEDIAESKRAELTEQRKEIQISQLELCVKHAKLVKYQAKLMLKALR